MKRDLLRSFISLSVLMALVLFTSTVYGQAKIQIDPDRWVSVGGGMRTAFRTTEVAPDSGSYVQKISLDSVRLYFNAQIHKDFQVEVNTEYDGFSSDVRVMDAVVKYAPSEYFNIWMGRHLTPSDRANLDGPFYLADYDYPGLVSQYPNLAVGRDNGVMFNGTIKESKVKWAFGMYDGSPTVLGAKDNMLYAGRIVVNLLQPEPAPVFYNGSTYYGDKDILAIGFVAQHQEDVINKAGSREAFTGYNVDLLFEKKLPSAGVVTLEGAFYDYHRGDTPLDGSAFLAQAEYLFPAMVGIGKIQPVFRYQDFLSNSQWDAGVNYVIKGHSARVSVIYTQYDNGAATASKTNQFTVGTQFQF